ncbi:MAG: hypothetical protein MK213_08220, partial [Planctomycetes bacterium]|nr:hypothetical protein [Planctomycetota bacterium]
MNLAPFWATTLLACLCVTSGHSILRRIHFEAPNGPGWLGASFLAGVGVLTVTNTLLGAIGWAVPWIPLAILGIVSLFLARPPIHTTRTGWITFLPACIALLPCCFLAIGHDLDSPDAWMRWAMHAQWLANTGELIPAEVHSPLWAITHPTYPPLMAAIGSPLLWLGDGRTDGLTGFMPWFLLATAGILHGFLIRRAPSLMAMVLPTALVLTPCMSWLARDQGGITGIGATTFLADLPLAAYLTAFAILLLNSFSQSEERGRATALGLAAGMAVLCKQEGLPTILLFLFSALWFAPCRRWLLTPTWVSLGTWVLWKAITWSAPIAEGENYLSIHGFRDLFQAEGKLTLIAQGIWQECLSFQRWGLLWPLACCGMILAWVQ